MPENPPRTFATTWPCDHVSAVIQESNYAEPFLEILGTQLKPLQDLHKYLTPLRLSLTALQSSSAISRTACGKGPFLIKAIVFPICSTLLAPRMIPSFSVSAEWYTIQRTATSIEVSPCDFTSTSNFLIAVCKSSVLNKACAAFPKG